MKTLYTIITIFILLFSLNSCGSGRKSTTVNTTPAPSNTTSGVAIDNYIKNATVCIDTNKNNDCSDENSTYITTTDSNGNFSFDNQYLNDDSIIIAYNGEDINTNESFKYIVKNIASNKSSDGKIVLSALTTLTVDYMNISSNDLNTSSSAVTQYLHDSNISVSSINEDIQSSTDYLKEQQKNLKLFAIVYLVNKDYNVSQDYNQSSITFQSIAHALFNDNKIHIDDSNITITRGVGSSTKTVAITNNAPVFQNKNSFVRYDDENQTFIVVLNAIDPEDDNITYTLQNNASGKFTLNDKNISFIASVPSFDKANYSNNQFTITVRATDYNTILGSEYSEQNISIRVTTTGWKIYDTRTMTDTNITLDAITYSWDDTNKWYGTNSAILIPIKKLANEVYAGNNLIKKADGHYDVNKTDYLDNLKISENIQHLNTDPFNTASGDTINAKDDNFQHDPVHNLFVSNIVKNSNGYSKLLTYLQWIDDNATNFTIPSGSTTSYTTPTDAGSGESVDTNNNGDTNEICAQYFGQGWRLPTAYEMGINTDSANTYKGYIPAYLGDTIGYIINSSSFTDNITGASTGALWSLKGHSGYSRSAGFSSSYSARCVYIK